MKPTFFATPADFRAWLEKHHATADELWVGFYKRRSGEPSITWPESVDEALSFGWIDGVRKSIDDRSYVIRFTPRKPRSIWSAVNIRRAKELIRQARMAPPGLKAFEAQSDERSAIYAYEQRRHASLEGAEDKQFRSNPAAWKFFQSQAPWYRRTSTHWIVSAKKPETRQKRLATLIAYSAQQKRIPPLDRTPKRA